MTPTRIVITGGTGLLGKALLETAPADLQVLGTYHRNVPAVEWRSRFRPLDVRDNRWVERFFNTFRPQAVIHTASVGAVDDAQQNPDAVREVNVEGTQIIARACERWGAHLIHISSNAVFNGEHPPYAEEAPLRAVNRYGEMKIEAEESVRKSLGTSLILRPILMYGWPFPWGRGNVVTRWLASLEKGEPIEVAQDVTSMPLFVTSCAEVIWAALQRKTMGIVHVAGKDRLDLVTFARQTARIFGFNEDLIQPVPSDRLDLLAPRPRDTSFVITRMIQELKVKPVSVAEGLTQMLRSRSLAI